MTSGPPTTAAPSDPPPIDSDLFCPECGYNLRGLTGGRCPECGREFDLASLAVSQIPWVHRDQIGVFRAYWRTAWLVTSQTRRLCDESIRPVSYRDAQRFRWVTILHVYLPVLLATIAIYVYPPSWSFGIGLVDEAYKIVWPVVTLNVGLVLVLAAITGVPSYFMHPRAQPTEQQNRAVALSFYACGPLAWLPLALLLGSVGPVLDYYWNAIGGDSDMLLLWAVLPTALGLCMVVALPTIWWVGLIGLARRTLQQRPGRVCMLALLVPILWLALTALILGGALLCVAHVGLVFVSLA